jgi:hypothetical protein
MLTGFQGQGLSLPIGNISVHVEDRWAESAAILGNAMGIILDISTKERFTLA